MAAAKEKLKGIVRRIIEVAQPLRIVLFGSAARGDATSRSDLDILIVVKTAVIAVGSPRMCTGVSLELEWRPI